MMNTQKNTFNPWEVLNPLFDEVIKGDKNNSAVYRGLMKTNILEKEDSFIFKIEMPNVKKENITVSLEDGDLIVSAKMENEVEEGAKYVLRESHYGTFSRSYYVGDNVKKEDIKAKLENGILTLSVLKRKEEPQKDIITID